MSKFMDSEEKQRRLIKRLQKKIDKNIASKKPLKNVKYECEKSFHFKIRLK